MAIGGLLFDKDGTLIDSVGTWEPVYREIMQEHLQHRAHEWESVFASAGWDGERKRFRSNSQLAAGTTLDFVELWWPELEGQEKHDKILWVNQQYRELSLKHLQPLMPLGPLLDEWKNMGFKIGIGTNDNEASARGHMERLGVTAKFDCILGYDSVKRAKPHGDMVHAFCEAVGLQPSEVAVIGDNLHDLDMARDAGAGLAIGVLTGNSERHDLEPHADVVLESIAELSQFLKERT
jgi:phosphoglycolate phosphatase